MAQVESKPLLSLCIPIYNRLAYLERQLARMLEDKELFEEQIELIISDNCSEDNLKSCCENYQQQGLNLTYHRNDTNIGADGNFDWCFHHADGKYVWLLGSDDIPVKGLLQKLLAVLEEGRYGFVHLSMIPRQYELKAFRDESIIADIGVWITFLSANIIRTELVKKMNLEDYMGSYMIQVPAYLYACLTSETNAIVDFGQLFEKDSDAANNGGYNLFRVFVENLFGIYKSFVDNGLMKRVSYERIKRAEYKNWLVNYVVDLLILRRPQRNNFDLDGSWSILLRYYGKYPYLYYYTCVCFGKRIARMVLRLLR